MLKRLLATLVVAMTAFVTPTKADITDGAFGISQIFDVQYYWSGTTLNASSFIAPYDKNFSHPTVGPGEYFKFVPSTTNPGDYGMNLYRADGTLKQVVHDYGQITALGNGAIFYLGSGWLGNVITPSAGYSYGSSASFTNMDTSVSPSDLVSYAWASTTPLAAGQTASAPVTPPVVTPNLVSINPTVVNVYPTSNNSPAGETALKALDSTSGTKYLNFDRNNAGFTIKLPAGKVVSGLQFTTANDFEPRDPTKFTLQGSNDGVNWTPIATDQAITLSSSRQTTTATVSVTNTNAYVYYFITFPSIKAIDQYGSVAGCQAALGTLACDSVQIGDVTFLSDSNNTSTSTDLAVVGSRVVNPGAPAPVTSPGTPVVTSTTTQGATTTTTTTSRGSTISNDAVTRGVTVVTTSFADTLSKKPRTFDVTRTFTFTSTTPLSHVVTNTTPVTTTVTTDTPSTTTTTTTPTTVTTYSDGTTTTTNGTPTTTTQTTTTSNPVSTTVNEIVFQTYQSTEVLNTYNSNTQSVASNGMTNAIAFRNNNLVMVNPLDKQDGSWAEPFGAMYRSHGTMKAQGAAFGYQKTIDNNTVGFAADVITTDKTTQHGSASEFESYNGSTYILTKQDGFWYKGAVGMSVANHTNRMSIPSFGLASTNKARQTNVYMDNTFYTSYDFLGFRPFAGVLVNHSTIGSTSSSGSPILYNTPDKKSTTFGLPYVGMRYDVSKEFSIEYRATQSSDFKTVHGVRASIKKEIANDVFLNFTLGSDHGGKGYHSAVGMVGLVVKF